MFESSPGSSMKYAFVTKQKKPKTHTETQEQKLLIYTPQFDHPTPKDAVWSILACNSNLWGWRWDKSIGPTEDHSYFLRIYEDDNFGFENKKLEDFSGGLPDLEVNLIKKHLTPGDNESSPYILRLTNKTEKEITITSVKQSLESNGSIKTNFVQAFKIYPNESDYISLSFLPPGDGVYNLPITYMITGGNSDGSSKNVFSLIRIVSNSEAGHRANIRNVIGLIKAASIIAETYAVGYLEGQQIRQQIKENWRPISFGEQFSQKRLVTIDRGPHDTVADWNRGIGNDEIKIDGKSIRSILEKERRIKIDGRQNVFATEIELKAFLKKYLFAQTPPRDLNARLEYFMETAHQGGMLYSLTNCIAEELNKRSAEIKEGQEVFEAKHIARNRGIVLKETPVMLRANNIAAINLDVNAPGARSVNFIPNHSGFTVEQESNIRALKVSSEDAEEYSIRADQGSERIGVLTATSRFNIKFIHGIAAPRLSIGDNLISYGNKKIEKYLSS